jgi:hypothetical protein
MAKKSKGKLQTRKDKKRPAARRQERRFIAHASMSPMVVYALGGLAAILLGGGAYGMIYAQSLGGAEDALRNLPSYLVAAGAVLLGITIWIGTTAEATVRVGDPGIAVEKGELRRMPWWAIEKITFDESAVAVVATGKDETGVPWTLKLGVKRHPEAIGWLVHEAAERIPRRLDIDDATQDKLPGASTSAGEKLELEPLQVVGKRCAATDKIISYEPDARVCRRCERVYLRTSVPKKCKCGNSLAELRPKDAENDADESPDSDNELDSQESEDNEGAHDKDKADKAIEAAES